jgi:hypothetical protein
LACLDLSDNNIGADGACAIADALKHNTSLTLTDLSDNNILDQSIVKNINHETSVNRNKEGDEYNAKDARLRQTRGSHTKACRNYTPEKQGSGAYVT